MQYGQSLTPEVVSRDLKSNLSEDAKISSTLDAPRWSDYHSPSEHISVRVASAEDVSNVIKYANAQSLPFLAQSGRTSPSTTFDLGPSPASGIIIDLSALTSIFFSSDGQSVRIGGGVTTKALNDKAYEKCVRVSGPNCNCVGIGGFLGGALSRAAGLYGWGVQNITSLEVVLADGSIVNVDRHNHPDLFWGLRGAGPCLGIVTALTLSTFPVSKDENYAFQGSLLVESRHMNKIAAEINRITSADPRAECHMLIANGGSPDFKPIVIVTPFYLTNDEAKGRQVFQSLIDLAFQTAKLGLRPYDQWNETEDPFCTYGGEKTWYTASLAGLDSETWHKALDRYARLVEEAGGEQIGQSGIVAETYNVSKVRELEKETPTSFAAAELPSHVVILATWTTPTVKDLVMTWAQETRDILRAGDGLNGEHACYVNFCHGDEPREYIWGKGQERLKELRRKYDPKNRFNQWLSP